MRALREFLIAGLLSLCPVGAVAAPTPTPTPPANTVYFSVFDSSATPQRKLSRDIYYDRAGNALRLPPSTSIKFDDTLLSATGGAALVGADTSGFNNSSSSDVQTVLYDLDQAIAVVAFDTEAELETLLTDVSDVWTDNDTAGGGDTLLYSDNLGDLQTVTLGGNMSFAGGTLDASVVTDHGNLDAGSLLDDDHTIYVLVDGSRTITGALTGATGTFEWDLPNSGGSAMYFKRTTAANAGIRLLNLTTGYTASDGLYLAAIDDGSAQVMNAESADLKLGTGNSVRATLDSGGLWNWAAYTTAGYLHNDSGGDISSVAEIPAGDLGAHASAHESGGADLVGHDSLTGFVAAEHYDWTNETHDITTTGDVTALEFNLTGNWTNGPTDSWTGTQSDTYAGVVLDADNDDPGVQFWRVWDSAFNVYHQLRDDGSVYHGANDSIVSEMRLYGNATTSGGTLRVFNGGSEDGTVNYFQFHAESTSFLLGANTNTNAFNFQGHTGDLDMEGDADVQGGDVYNSTGALGVNNSGSTGLTTVGNATGGVDLIGAIEVDDTSSLTEAGGAGAVWSQETTGSQTTANGTLAVEIAGTTYYLLTASSLN